MIDKQTLITRFEANYDTYDLLATVQDSICELLSNQLDKINLSPNRILEIGAGTGLLTKRLKKVYSNANFAINDLSPRSAQFVARYTDYNNALIIGDAEQINLGSEYNLVASASAIQWFVDIEKFFHKIKTTLCDEGVFAFSTFGPQNFIEIKHITGSGLDYPSLDQLKQMLKRLNFEIIYSCEYCQTMEFDQPIDVLKHIKATGVNALHKQMWTPRKMAHFSDEYINLFSNKNGSVRLTYHPIIIICRAF